MVSIRPLYRICLSDIVSEDIIFDISEKLKSGEESATVRAAHALIEHLKEKEPMRTAIFNYFRISSTHLNTLQCRFLAYNENLFLDVLVMKLKEIDWARVELHVENSNLTVNIDDHPVVVRTESKWCVEQSLKLLRVACSRSIRQILWTVGGNHLLTEEDIRKIRARLDAYWLQIKDMFGANYQIQVSFIVESKTFETFLDLNYPAFNF